MHGTMNKKKKSFRACCMLFPFNPSLYDHFTNSTKKLLITLFSSLLLLRPAYIEGFSSAPSSRTRRVSADPSELQTNCTVQTKSNCIKGFRKIAKSDY